MFSVYQTHVNHTLGMVEATTNSTKWKKTYYCQFCLFTTNKNRNMHGHLERKHRNEKVKLLVSMLKLYESILSI